MILFLSNDTVDVSLLLVSESTERGIIAHLAYTDNSTSQGERSSGFHSTASDKPDGVISSREKTQPEVQHLVLAPVKPDGA